MKIQFLLILLKNLTILFFRSTLNLYIIHKTVFKNTWKKQYWTKNINTILEESKKN